MSEYSSADVERFWSKVNRDGPTLRAELGPYWPWTGSKLRKGYGNLSVARRTKVASRVSWELHRGPIPDGLQVLHKCDNTGCVNPDHLFVGTNQDNVDDKIAKGRQPRGEDAGLARLTEQQVLEIRERAAGGESQPSIAARFGIARNTVSNVASGKVWAHVGGVTLRKPREKLTEEQVRQIRRRSEGCTALAAEFGVSKSQISAIRRGKKWQHVA